MNIKVDWANEDKTVILMTYLTKWTWSEFDAAIDESNALMASVDHRVDVIIDTRLHPRLPDPYALSHMQRARNLQPANFGQIVIVGGVYLMRQAGEIIIKVLGWKGSIPRFTNSVEEAQKIIDAHRAPQPVP